MSIFNDPIPTKINLPEIADVNSRKLNISCFLNKETLSLKNGSSVFGLTNFGSKPCLFTVAYLNGWFLIDSVSNKHEVSNFVWIEN